MCCTVLIGSSLGLIKRCRLAELPRGGAESDNYLITVCSLRSVQCELHSVHCAVCSVQFAVCSVQSTIFAACSV